MGNELSKTDETTGSLLKKKKKKKKKWWPGDPELGFRMMRKRNAGEKDDDGVGARLIDG